MDKMDITINARHLITQMLHYQIPTQKK